MYSMSRRKDYRNALWDSHYITPNISRDIFQPDILQSFSTVPGCSTFVLLGVCCTELELAPPQPTPPELSDFGVPLFGFLFLVCKPRRSQLYSTLRLDGTLLIHTMERGFP